MMKLVRKIFKWTLIIGTIFTIMILTLVIVCNVITNSCAKDKVFDEISDIPKNKVGLVLGTSSKTVNGNANQYFKYRMQAAAELYKAGKVEYLIVSGDNHLAYYNEPREMKKALIALGVPDSVIYLDYAGFRTFDSVIRAKEIFGQSSATIISQRFHNERAIFIAEHFGINAIGYNANDVSVKVGFKTRLREYLARVKMMLDIYVLRTKPKFLGEKIEIGEPQVIVR